MLAATPCGAQNATYDLAGPVLRVTVARAGVSLPLSQVPSLAVGDRIRIEGVPPQDGTSRYLVVLAFLRGATDPPPKEWLVSANPRDTAGGATLDAVVPDGALQASILLVPRTSGAMKAVEKAVLGKPGVFVRAVQELTQTSLDRARLDAYLAGVRSLGTSLEQAADTARLGRNLAVKVDPGCLVRQADVQATCGAPGGVAVLADAQTSSLAQTLAGTPADVALQVSSTPQAGFGYYSPYLGLVRDVARIFGAFQSAQLQFVPAVEAAQGEQTRFLLNAAPSFRRPQSVLVAPLPAVAAGRPPSFAAAADDALCATRPSLLLPVSGAPLVLATAFAHDMALRIVSADGRPLDLPVRADAVRGGYVVGEKIAAGTIAGEAVGVLHGRWGFDSFDGPRFRLVAPTAGAWRIADHSSLVVGRDSPLALQGGAAPCVDGVAMERGGARLPVAWSVSGERGLDLKVPLDDADPGPVDLLVTSGGLTETQRIAVRAYAEPSRISAFTVRAGDQEGVLVGTRLDQVASLEVGGSIWHPDALQRRQAADHLLMRVEAGEAELRAGDHRQAHIVLTDGRTTTLKVTVAAPGPTAAVVSRSVERARSVRSIPISLDADVVAQDSRLVFSFRAQVDARLVAGQQVEVMSESSGATAKLPVRLQDARVGLVAFTPAVDLGSDVSGPISFRLVRDDVAGHWQPLATVVRLPTVASISCFERSRRCALRGESLFLLKAVSSGERSDDRVQVPDGFTGTSLDIPYPANGRLRLQLRDAPAVEAWIRAGS